MTDQPQRLRRGLALAAAVLGGLAVVAGEPKPRSAALDVAALARAVTAEQDHVAALELARWITARQPGLRVLDVRTVVEYDELHIPSAEPLTLEALAGATFKPGETVVLYSEGGAEWYPEWTNFIPAQGVALSRPYQYLWETLDAEGQRPALVALLWAADIGLLHREWRAVQAELERCEALDSQAF